MTVLMITAGPNTAGPDTAGPDTAGPDTAGPNGDRPEAGASGLSADGTPVLVPLPRIRRAGPRLDEAFTIDCADCCHQQTSVCDDCVVSFIVGRQPEDAVVVDAEQARAVRLLERAGLVPGVRHSRRASGD
jgi:hypothetical protein